MNLSLKSLWEGLTKEKNPVSAIIIQYMKDTQNTVTKEKYWKATKDFWCCPQ